MKKRLLIFLVFLIFITGCTCQYNLEIDGSTYKEEIIITAENSEERNQLNQKWNISTNKNDYEFAVGEEETEIEYEYDPYEYVLSGNTLKFNYNFDSSEYNDSYAVSNCYNSLNIMNHSSEEGRYIVISTSEKNTCFEKYPNLTKLTVNITLDKEVTSHNADRKDGNTYIWNITKDNAKEKSINLIYKVFSYVPSSSSSESSENIEIVPDNSSNQFGLYIFAGIMIILVLFGYFKFKKMKEKSDNMDD